ncbi:hypothetical protein EV361DRAFT_803020 [Lentinula raphanica]|nr:hypothetical protein EV361DRAFT_803020 [Lentinula raphanica]
MTLDADLSSDEEKKLQEWLGAPDCSINYITALNKRANGTGQWIFEDPTYLRWRKEKSILWIQGQVFSVSNETDSFLTCFSTSIIKDLKAITNSAIITYHYFDTRDNSGAKTSFQGLLLSLLLQLGAQNQKIHPALKDLHKSLTNGMSHSKPSNEDLTITLNKIIEDLVQKGWKIYLIMDALDECKETAKVSEFCMQMAKFGSIGIIISSRDHQPSNQQYSTISLRDNKMVAEDIALFLEEQILLKSITLKTRVKAKLLDKANGGFRYADCQVQILKECTSERKIHEALTKLPSSLKKIYFGAINKCKHGSHSEEVHHLLLWLLYSFEPLYMSQVAVILSIDLKSGKVDSDAEMLIGLEKIIDTTLVTVDSKNIVQLAHASVKEFLLESNDSIHKNKLFKVNAQLGHNIIAQMCLIYLLKQTEYKDIRMESSYVWKIIIQTFEQYATQYWGEHSQYNDKNSLSCKDAMKLTEKLLEPGCEAFMNWRNNFQVRNAVQPDEIINIFLDGTSLHVTAWFGLGTSTKILLGNPNTGRQSENTLTIIISNYNGTALQVAAARGHNNITELLFQHGADINSQGGIYGTALQAAAAEGHKDTVEFLFLVQHGAEINAQGAHYGTALQAAIVQGHKDTVEFLVQRGAGINAQGGYYGTALQAAQLRL